MIPDEVLYYQKPLRFYRLLYFLNIKNRHKNTMIRFHEIFTFNMHSDQRSPASL